MSWVIDTTMLRILEEWDDCIKQCDQGFITNALNHTRKIADIVTTLESYKLVAAEVLETCPNWGRLFVFSIFTNYVSVINHDTIDDVQLTAEFWRVIKSAASQITQEYQSISTNCFYLIAKKLIYYASVNWFGIHIIPPCGQEITDMCSYKRLCAALIERASSNEDFLVIKFLDQLTSYLVSQKPTEFLNVYPWFFTVVKHYATKWSTLSILPGQ